jgi:hypothetical protein
MTTTIELLPANIIQAIKQEKLSRNHVIYYDVEHGWVCQQGDNTFINSIPNLIEQNADTNLYDNTRPLEELGPFGR